MNSQSHNVRTTLLLSVATLAFASLPACATDQARTTAAPTQATAKPSPCKSGDTVGFSCEMRDHRVIALCVSPGFEKHQGAPAENPGYAYLAVDATTGHSAQSYPVNPLNFRQHMSTGITLAGAPYLRVATEKGSFFYANGRSDIPVSANQDNQPEGWSLPAQGDDSLCKNRGNREHFDAVLSQIPRKAD